MNKERRSVSFSPPIVGGSSLLVIFAVLCLTTFAILSLTSVKANERLAQRSREAVQEYYAADLQAETILAEIRGGKVPEAVTVEGDLYSYVCKISETQELQVEVRCSGSQWEVLRWMAVSTAKWEENDDSINVWDGEVPAQ